VGWFTVHPMPGDCYQAIKLPIQLLLVKRCVLFDEFLLVFGHIFERLNRIGGASWNASSTVDTAFGIHVHLSGGFKAGLVLLGVNTVSWADINAKRVFDAGIIDYIGHGESVSWNEHFWLAHKRVYEGGREMGGDFGHTQLCVSEDRSEVWSGSLLAAGQYDST